MMMREDSLWRLKQLAELHLGHNLFIAAFLRDIHKLIHCYSCSYLWLDKQGHILNIYDERVPQHFIHQIGQFLHQADLPSLDDLREWILELNSPHQPTADNLSISQLHHLYRHTFFKAGYYHNLFIPIFLNNRKVGILTLHRQARESRFDHDEVSISTQIAELLAHGLNRPPSIEHLMVNGFEEGLITLNNNGEIQNLCTTAEKLLTLASQTQGNRPLETGISLNLRSFIGLDAFINNLLLEKTEEANHADFSLSRQNQWGEFKLSGFVIHDSQGRRAPQICLNIKWLVPFTLNLFQRIESLQLTPRQETVALLYAAGHPTKTMATSLGLSLYTVKEHVQNIFERLQIHSRAELIELIVCDDRLS